MDNEGNISGCFFILVGTGSSCVFESFLVLQACEHLSLHTPATKRRGIKKPIVFYGNSQNIQLLLPPTCIGGIIWPAYITTWIAEQTLWCYQFLVNCCFQSTMLDHIYLVRQAYWTRWWTLPIYLLVFFSITYLFTPLYHSFTMMHFTIILNRQHTS